MDLPRKIYAIQHNVTKRIYIGSTKDVRSRYLAHIHNLRNGKHPNEDMQEDFETHGENYSLFILDEITKFEDRKKEYEYMRQYKTHIRGIGYNYNDHAVKQESEHVNNSVPLMDGIPEQYNAAISMREQYRSKIAELVGRCQDLSLLDFVFQLLDKEQGRYIGQ